MTAHPGGVLQVSSKFIGLDFLQAISPYLPDQVCLRAHFSFASQPHPLVITLSIPVLPRSASGVQERMQRVVPLVVYLLSDRTASIRMKAIETLCELVGFQCTAQDARIRPKARQRWRVFFPFSPFYLLLPPLPPPPSWLVSTV